MTSKVSKKIKAGSESGSDYDSDDFASASETESGGSGAKSPDHAKDLTDAAAVDGDDSQRTEYFDNIRRKSEIYASIDGKPVNRLIRLGLDVDAADEENNIDRIPIPFDVRGEDTFSDGNMNEGEEAEIEEQDGDTENSAGNEHKKEYFDNLRRKSEFYANIDGKPANRQIRLGLDIQEAVEDSEDESVPIPFDVKGENTFTDERIRKRSEAGVEVKEGDSELPEDGEAPAECKEKKEYFDNMRRKSEFYANIDGKPANRQIRLGLDIQEAVEDSEDESVPIPFNVKGENTFTDERIRKKSEAGANVTQFESGMPADDEAPAESEGKKEYFDNMRRKSEFYANIDGKPANRQIRLGLDIQEAVEDSEDESVPIPFDVRGEKTFSDERIRKLSEADIASKKCDVEILENSAESGSEECKIETPDDCCEKSEYFDNLRRKSEFYANIDGKPSNRQIRLGLDIQEAVEDSEDESVPIPFDVKGEKTFTDERIRKKSEAGANVTQFESEMPADGEAPAESQRKKEYFDNTRRKSEFYANIDGKPANRQIRLGLDIQEAIEDSEDESVPIPFDVRGENTFPANDSMKTPEVVDSKIQDSQSNTEPSLCTAEKSEYFDNQRRKSEFYANIDGKPANRQIRLGLDIQEASENEGEDESIPIPFDVKGEGSVSETTDTPTGDTDHKKERGEKDSTKKKKVPTATLR